MKTSILKPLTRGLLLAVIVLSAAFLALHVVNLRRLDSETFDQSARELIQRFHKIEDGASPRYQEEVLSKLPPNPKNGIFYRLDDLLPEAVVREKPSPLRDDKIPGVILSFEFDDPRHPGLVSVEKNGLLRVKHRHSDYLTNELSVKIPKDDIGYIVIRARVNKGSQMKLAWHKEPLPAEIWWNRIDIDLIDNTNFHTYVIEAENALKRGLSAGDCINKIFIAPSDADGALAEIDYIRFVSKLAKYSLQPRGIDYETLGQEMRCVLYMLPAQTLEYSLRIPEKSPRLDSGIGVLIDNEPVEFEIALFNGRRSKKIFRQRLDRASGWHDLRIDLTPWAGQNVELSLRVSGSIKNVAFWSNPLISSEPDERFQAIIVLEDAERADHLPTYGYQLPTSPVKERLLAERGIVFPHAISQETWTRPAVSALMTSLLPTATGVWHWSDVLGPEYLTLAEIMRAQGFVTAAFVQNENAGPNAGLQQGFGQVFDREIMGGSTEGVLGERLLAWLERNRHRNFFLYLHIHDPHGPYDPPAPFDRWYRESPFPGKAVKRDYLDPPWVQHPTIEGRRLLYDGEILHNDSLMPGFLAKLESLGLSQNTLLVFMADHGEHLGEHHLWDHKPPGYIQVLHIPLGFVYPALFTEARKIPPTVQLVDVMPTILELAGIDSASFLLAGDSLVGLIKGEKLPFWENRMTISDEVFYLLKKHPRLSSSVFFHDLHSITSISLWPGARFLPPPVRMSVFNFQKDRDEKHTLLSFLPDLVIKHKLLKVMKDVQEISLRTWKKWTGGPTETYRLNPEAIERLRALGYIK
jgi:hypothetical protein